MRLKKGSKVEVLKKSNVPPGSWWCAEIVSGNGHTYNVKYDQPPSNTSEVIMERVPRKAIGPCPPPFEEVFEMSSWKLAEVARVVSRNHYFVRLLGSSEFKVHKSFIRVWQSWKDGRWVLIGKRKQSELMKGDLRVDVHQLELRAYLRTMKALYASGPLSWDQETLITNLWFMLHISNDEHLSEIRHLVSDEMDS
ncbi:hypothetical protein QJS04_geneDACA015555 [Acorus gramineus]|uniref:ENT domain-containing protein n=1 Tax=Acorus gramineus TaxID=55184 RepID=A0AAV9ANQ0_ACOGR|nr:hypothetical protein QJS04_geneDACA015555 [Acorus gramineus]